MSEHDSERGEIIAGWYHLGLGIAYVLCVWWHFKGAYEHFVRKDSLKGVT